MDKPHALRARRNRGGQRPAIEDRVVRPVGEADAAEARRFRRLRLLEHRLEARPGDGGDEVTGSLPSRLVVESLSNRLVLLITF